MSKVAQIEFMARLIAGFCLSAPTDAQQQEYDRALSRHSLTPDHWNRVYDLLTDWHRQKFLPPLGMIYSAISEVQIPERYEAASRRGKMIFRLNGYEYALIVQLESKSGGGEHWVIASVIGRKHGAKVELQKNAGMEAHMRLLLIPGAEFVGIYPDDPKLAWNGDMPTAQELAAIRAEFQQSEEARKGKILGNRTSQGDGKWIAMENDTFGEYMPRRSERVA